MIKYEGKIKNSTAVVVGRKYTQRGINVLTQLGKKRIKQNGNKEARKRAAMGLLKSR